MWLIDHERKGKAQNKGSSGKILSSKINVARLLTNEGLLSCLSCNYTASQTSTKSRSRSVTHQELNTQEGNNKIELKLKSLQVKLFPVPNNRW